MLVFVAVVLILFGLRDSDASETTTVQYLGIKWLHFCFRIINKEYTCPHFVYSGLNSRVAKFNNTVDPSLRKAAIVKDQ